MELRVVIAGKGYTVDLDQPKSLAITLDFDGPQPSFFGAPRATAAPLHGDGFIGDTQRGGSCNVAEIHLVPHCNGTHTESMAHIDRAGPAVSDALPQSLFPAAVVSVTPAPATESAEAYRPEPEDGDRLITAAALEAATAGYADDAMTGLVVRTLPNDPGKAAAQYDADNPPAYFTNDAMRFLTARGVRHLLADVPSIDRMADGGLLTNHRIFWTVTADGGDGSAGAATAKTVTEMVFVADDITDGLYLLNLQIPAFMSDAAPSRPVLYGLVTEV